MVLYEAVSDFSPNLVRIFERGLDSQQSRILTACCFNIADISHLSKSEMHAWTFLSCLNFWTDWQWVENTRKSGSCAILIHLRSELRTQLPLWPHFLLWAPSTPQLQVRPQLFSMFLQKSHENSENFGQKWALVHLKGFVNHLCRVAQSWIEAETWQGAVGWLLTAPRAQHPIHTSLDPLGALLGIPLGFGQMLDWQLAQDLFSMHDDTGESTEERVFYKECCISEHGEDVITEKKMHQMFCKSDSLSEK